MQSTYANLANYLAKTRQPASYVAGCARITEAKLTRFLSNQGSLSSKETERLDEFLGQHRSWLKSWVVRAGAAATVIGGAACTSTVQEGVKAIIRHFFP
ncbi:MAG: hypothetical protein K1X78_12915 [Verrucomicrobiaceae bacterium]|nr:hypothetical protein [Verrucomicrobiaceae bacterium]